MINPGLVISLTFLDDFYIIFFKHAGVICNNPNLMYLWELKWSSHDSCQSSCLILKEMFPVPSSKVYILMVERDILPVQYLRCNKSLAEQVLIIISYFCILLGSSFGQLGLWILGVRASLIDYIGVLWGRVKIKPPSSRNRLLCSVSCILFTQWWVVALHRNVMCYLLYSG